MKVKTRFGNSARRLGFSPRQLGLTPKQLAKCRNKDDLVVKLKAAKYKLSMIIDKLVAPPSPSVYVYNSKEKKVLEQQMRAEGRL